MTHHRDLLEDETLVIDGRTYFTDYGYNNDAALLYQLSPGGRSVNVAPNGLGQPTRARIAGFDHASGGTYHPSGGLLTLDYANGQSLTNEYFPRQLLKSTRVQKAGAYAVWFAYGHDDNGRITSITDGAVAGQNRTFGYDDVGRLTSATGPWGTGSFTYDSLGNIREKVLGARTVSLQYDPTSAFGGAGRLTSVKDTGGDNVWRAFTYDAKGNTTWHGLGLRTLAYDAAEQPTSITGNGVTGAFVYDGNLKRVKQVVNGETIYSVYGQSGALLYRDNATTGETTDYVRMGGRTVARLKTTGGATTTSYLHQNHLGSPVAATDTGGTVLWREHWTPFGEKLVDPAGNQNDEGFTGHIDDAATGLTYMQARYMDPVIGRFLSNDPVGFSPDQPQMFNRYSYTLNDPVNAFDPDGERTFWVQLDVWWGEIPTKAPHGHARPGFKDNMLMGREFTGGLYISIPTAKGQRWDVGGFRSHGKTRGVGGGVGADAGSQEGDDRDLAGKSVAYNGDLVVGGSVIRDGEGNTIGGTLGTGPGLGASRAEITTSTFGLRDAASAIGALFSDERATVSQNKDGTVSATISRTGSRLTRELTCASGSDGEVSCN